MGLPGHRRGRRPLGAARRRESARAGRRRDGLGSARRRAVRLRRLQRHLAERPVGLQVGARRHRLLAADHSVRRAGGAHRSQPGLGLRRPRAAAVRRYQRRGRHRQRRLGLRAGRRRHRRGALDPPERRRRRYPMRATCTARCGTTRTARCSSSAARPPPAFCNDLWAFRPNPAGGAGPGGRCGADAAAHVALLAAARCGTRRTGTCSCSAGASGSGRFLDDLWAYRPAGNGAGVWTSLGSPGVPDGRATAGAAWDAGRRRPTPRRRDRRGELPQRHLRLSAWRAAGWRSPRPARRPGAATRPWSTTPLTAAPALRRYRLHRRLQRPVAARRRPAAHEQAHDKDDKDDKDDEHQRAQAIQETLHRLRMLRYFPPKR